MDGHMDNQHIIIPRHNRVAVYKNGNENNNETKNFTIQLSHDRGSTDHLNELNGFIFARVGAVIQISFKENV